MVCEQHSGIFISKWKNKLLSTIILFCKQFLISLVDHEIRNGKCKREEWPGHITVLLWCFFLQYCIFASLLYIYKGKRELLTLQLFSSIISVPLITICLQICVSYSGNTIYIVHKNLYEFVDIFIIYVLKWRRFYDIDMITNYMIFEFINF